MLIKFLIVSCQHTLITSFQSRNLQTAIVLSKKYTPRRKFSILQFYSAEIKYPAKYFQSMKINIIDEFGKKTFHGTKRMQVLSQPIRFENLGDMFLIHYFKINIFFKKSKFCKLYAAFAQNSSHNDVFL